MQTPKARIGSSEVPHKVSPRAAHQLKPTALDTDSASSSRASRTPKDRSPKVSERKSPRSPAPEKKRPSRITELESQISQLQEELKKSKDLLNYSELSEKQAQQDADESKKQLLDLTSKLEESQQRLLLLSASEETGLTELQNISQEWDQACESGVENTYKEVSVDSAALAHAINETQWLKNQLEMVAASEDAHKKYAESANAEAYSLKGKLAESLSLVENMKIQLEDSKDSEAQAQVLVNETLLQLETLKTTVEILRSEGAKAMDAYDSVASELDQSRAHISLLEGLVSKVDVGLVNVSDISQNPVGSHGFEKEFEEKLEINESSLIEGELNNLKSEVARLRSALENAETRNHEEHVKSTVQITNANEVIDQLKSQSSLREAELETELKKTKADIDDLKANLMDKETELQGIIEENEELNLKLEKKLLGQREHEMEKELKKLNEKVLNLKANLMDKETEFQNILEENGQLKLEMNQREKDKNKVNDEVITDVEAARSAEKEALVKLEVAIQEADKSNRRAARVAEQLEAEQATNSEMEAELRRLKVQCDQWRKAAEAAATMLSAGSNGKFMERTGSLDSSYNNSGTGKMNLPYSEDMDDDLIKKKNGNMLKKIGVLWKKPAK